MDQDPSSKRFQVAIVGAGPRGLGILERLSVLLKADGKAHFDIVVVDPGVPGQGIHRDSQPEHLLTNTAAGSTTIFVDDSVRDAGPPRPGPSLGEWMERTGYRVTPNGPMLSADGHPVGNDAFVPRAILGKYLGWAYEEIVSRMPSCATVRHRACRAVHIAKRHDGRIGIGLRDGTRVDADFVFLTTGHAGSGPTQAEIYLEERVASLQRRNPKLAYLRGLDPIERLNEIDPSARVAICGTGLTAIDAVSMFTHGRGGLFSQVDKQRLRYRSSGREPHITLFSRQGLPPTSRAIDRKGVGRTYAARFFTHAFVDGLKRRKAKLDWTADLRPILEKEMALRLLRAGSDIEPQSSTFEPSAEHTQAIDAFLRPWEHVTIADASAHADHLRHHLEADIAASFVGNVDEPFKGIVEIIRDLNDVVRHAVDYGGLTSTSHREFLRDWCSINNRVAAGPPKERNMELLSLMEAGVVRLFEPDPIVDLVDDAACFELVSDAFSYTHRDQFDILIQARVGLLQPHTTTDPLLSSGLESGLLSAFDNGGFAPSGIAIDQRLNVIDARGRSVPNCWATGYVVEGAHYYTYVLPCPSANSRSQRDAGKAVMAMIEEARAKIALGASREPPEFARLST